MSQFLGMLGKMQGQGGGGGQQQSQSQQEQQALPGPQVDFSTIKDAVERRKRGGLGL